MRHSLLLPPMTEIGTLQIESPFLQCQKKRQIRRKRADSGTDYTRIDRALKEFKRGY